MSKDTKTFFHGQYVDLGEDLNLYVPEEKGKRDNLSSSLFVDDTIKSFDVALSETKKKLAPYWINSDPLVAAYVDEVGESYFFYLSEELKNNVVLFLFMDPFMPHTLRGLPYVKEWLRRYSGAGLTVIGIFYSRFGFHNLIDHLTTELHRLHVDFPVYLDHDAAMWRALENRYWPRYIIMNHEQKIIGNYIGAGGYQKIETTIQHSLRAISPGLACPRLLKPLNEFDESPSTNITSSSFFGFSNPDLANQPEERLSEDGNDVVFTTPENAVLDTDGQSYFVGPWLGDKNSAFTSITPYQKNLFQGDAIVGSTFKARSVYLLCSTRNFLNTDVSSAIRVQVTIDGKSIKDSNRGSDVKAEDGKKSFIYVHAPKLFEIAKNFSPNDLHKVQVHLPAATAGNFQIYAFYYTN